MLYAQMRCRNEILKSDPGLMQMRRERLHYSASVTFAFSPELDFFYHAVSKSFTSLGRFTLQSKNLNVMALFIKEKERERKRESRVCLI